MNAYKDKKPRVNASRRLLLPEYRFQDTNSGMKIPQVTYDPGVLFALANVFAMFQSGSMLAIAITLCAAALAIISGVIFSNIQDYKRKGTALWPASKLLKGFISNQPPSLFINACGILIAGLVSLQAGAILPGIAGLAFACGNFMAASRRATQLQLNMQAGRWVRTLTHPTVYFGVGYAAIGLMAGGGMELLEDPSGNMPALTATLLGIGATTFSSAGLLSGIFSNPATPFMIIVAGTAFNIASGIASGNMLGSINNFFSLCGALRLAWLAEDAYKAKGLPQESKMEKRILLPMLALRSFVRNS